MTYFSIMKKGIQRREVYLSTSTVNALIKKAKEQGRSLKNYMEQLLIKDAEK